MNRLSPNDFANISRKDLDMPEPLKNLTDKAAEEASVFLAKKLDESIATLVEAVAGHPMSPHEVIHEGRFLKLRTHANQEPAEWENFFIFRRTVMAYRYLTGSHMNDNTHALMLDYTFQSMVLSEDQWPQAVRNFMAETK